METKKTINLSKNHNEFAKIAKAIKFLKNKYDGDFRSMLYFGNSTIYASDGRRLFKSATEINAQGFYKILKNTKTEIVLVFDELNASVAYEKVANPTLPEKIELKQRLFDLFAQKLIRKTTLFFNLDFLRDIFDGLSSEPVKIYFGSEEQPLKFEAKGEIMLLMPIKE